MATARATYAAEMAIGHDDSAITRQDVANYGGDTGDSQTMKALVWQGKNKVEVGKWRRLPTRDMASSTSLRGH